MNFNKYTVIIQMCPDIYFQSTALNYFKQMEITLIFLYIKPEYK